MDQKVSSVDYVRVAELIPAIADEKANLVVIRIDAVYPHADGFRYDLTWPAMEAGTYDLAKFLRSTGTQHFVDRRQPIVEVGRRNIAVNHAGTHAAERLMAEK